MSRVQDSRTWLMDDARKGKSWRGSLRRTILPVERQRFDRAVLTCKVTQLLGFDLGHLPIDLQFGARGGDNRNGRAVFFEFLLTELREHPEFNSLSGANFFCGRLTATSLEGAGFHTA